MRIILACAAAGRGGLRRNACAPREAVAAKPAAASAAAAKQTAQANGEEPTKVCRRMMITGTLQPKRICSTPEEWAAFDKSAKEGSDRLDQMRRSGANTGIGGRPQR